MFFKRQPTHFKWVDAKIIKKRISPTAPIHFSTIFKKRSTFQLVFTVDLVHFLNSYQSFNILTVLNCTLSILSRTLAVFFIAKTRSFPISVVHCFTCIVPSSKYTVHFKKNTVPFFRWLFLCSLYLCKWAITV